MDVLSQTTVAPKPELNSRFIKLLSKKLQDPFLAGVAKSEPETF